MPVERSGQFDDLHPSNKDKPTLSGDEIETANEFGLVAGKNLPNHSMSMIGRGSFVRPTAPGTPVFRSRQQLYRFAAWLMRYSEELPDEDDRGHTFEQIREAVRKA